MSGYRGRRFLLAALFLPGIVSLLAMSPEPTFAWTAPKQQFHLRMRNNTGGNVNDLRVRVSARSGGAGPWSAPTEGIGFTPHPGWGWVFPATVEGNSLVYTFVGGLIPPNGFAWFNVYFRIPGNTPPYEANCWYQWTLNGTPVGEEVWWGFCISSPAKIGNPSLRPDGSANTQNIVFRNLQFANTATSFANNVLTLDNAAVQAAFAASSDPTRPGPFTVTPGECFDISDLHASIGPPVSNGQAVLVKGIIQDQTGQQYDFVSQFEAPPPIMPASSPVPLVLLAIGLLGLGAFVLMRRRA